MFLIEPPALRRNAATDKLVEKIIIHDSWPVQPDILRPPLLRLTSRKPLWLDLQPVDIKSRWLMKRIREEEEVSIKASDGHFKHFFDFDIVFLAITITFFTVADSRTLAHK